MVTWRVSLNVWLVKNLQYMLFAFELLFFCRSLGFYSGLTSLLFFSQSRQPLAMFSTHLCTWVHKYVHCKGPAALSSPSFVTKKRHANIVVYCTYLISCPGVSTNWHSEHDLKLTFLGNTTNWHSQAWLKHTYVCTYTCTSWQYILDSEPRAKALGNKYSSEL